MKMTPVTPCACGESHAPGTVFYVSVLRDPDRTTDYRLVAGPFGTHAEALAWVEPAHGLILARYNPGGAAHWYGYGTAGLPPDAPHPPGILNAELGIRLPEEVAA